MLYAFYLNCLKGYFYENPRNQQIYLTLRTLPGTPRAHGVHTPRPVPHACCSRGLMSCRLPECPPTGAPCGSAQPSAAPLTLSLWTRRLFHGSGLFCVFVFFNKWTWRVCWAGVPALSSCLDPLAAPSSCCPRGPLGVPPTPPGPAAPPQASPNRLRGPGLPAPPTPTLCALRPPQLRPPIPATLGVSSCCHCHPARMQPEGPQVGVGAAGHRASGFPQPSRPPPGLRGATASAAWDSHLAPSPCPRLSRAPRVLLPPCGYASRAWGGPDPPLTPRCVSVYRSLPVPASWSTDLQVRALRGVNPRPGLGPGWPLQ